jgi:hypothetical protein
MIHQIMLDEKRPLIEGSAERFGIDVQELVCRLAWQRGNGLIRGG